MANLMEPVSGLVTADVAEKVAAAAGESPDPTRAALLGSVPALFAALAQLASTPQGASVVFDTVTRAAGKRGLAEAREGGTQGLLFNLFGRRTECITDELASSTGVRRTSAAGILGLMAPLVLALIGKETVSRGLNAGGLRDVLFSHKKAVLDHPNTPNGLAGALGIANLSELGGPAACIAGPTACAVEAAREAPGSSVDTDEGGESQAPRERTGRFGSRSLRALRRVFLLPTLLLGALTVWGLSSVLKGRPSEIAPTDRDNPTLRQGPEVPERERTLPASGKLTFEDGSTTLTADSEEAVRNLAKVLVANPSVTTRVVGFADRGSGSRVPDEALSKARAESVKGLLVAHGVDGARIETAGMSRVRPNEIGYPDEPRGAEIKLVQP